MLRCYDKEQFSYRPFSSTVCALVTIQDSVVRLLDDCNVAGVHVITLDMSRAFDSVPHDLILSFLRNLDLPDCELFVNWINSYLNNRKQRVRLFNTYSSVSNVLSGVPQGSVLGPYLFALFMSTYHSLFDDTCLIKYADDVTLIVPVYKHDLNSPHATLEVHHFQNWCNVNGMSINVSKSKCMSVFFGLNVLPTVSDLQSVTALKILGVIFNHKLTWSDHFAYVCQKVSRRLYVLRVLKSIFSHDQLVTVFQAIIRSLFDYACPVFLNPGSILNDKFVSLCKRAFRIIHGSDCVHCDQCDLMNVQARRERLSLRLFTEALEDRRHSLHQLLPHRSQRSGSRLLLPHVRCTRRVKAFIFSCALMCRPITRNDFNLFLPSYSACVSLCSLPRLIWEVSLSLA